MQEPLPNVDARAADVREWIHAHLAKQPPPIKNLPAAIAAIIAKLLAKLPEDRYQSAAGVEADLRRCLFEWEAHGVMLLATRGHEVTIAGEGRQALAQIESSPFDALLLDVHLPEIDGFQVIKVFATEDPLTAMLRGHGVTAPALVSVSGTGGRAGARVCAARSRAYPLHNGR